MFCDIRNNQGLAKVSAFGSADNTYLDLNYSGYHKNLVQWIFKSRYTVWRSLITFKREGRE